MIDPHGLHIFQVEYTTNDFDLTVPEHAFCFLFQLYNFLSEAKVDNDYLRDPQVQLQEADASVGQKGYQRFSKRKHEETGISPECSCGPPVPEGAEATSSSQPIQELTGAGYALVQPISQESEELTVCHNSRHCTR
jgi:hypothetical protein